MTVYQIFFVFLDVIRSESIQKFSMKIQCSIIISIQKQHFPKSLKKI